MDLEKYDACSKGFDLRSTGQIGNHFKPVAQVFHDRGFIDIYVVKKNSFGLQRLAKRNISNFQLTTSGESLSKYGLQMNVHEIKNSKRFDDLSPKGE